MTAPIYILELIKLMLAEILTVAAIPFFMILVGLAMGFGILKVQAILEK
jgi:PetM family of cytochrome b6f complex subunit 7